MGRVEDKKKLRICSASKSCGKQTTKLQLLVSGGPGLTLLQKKAREDLARYLNQTPDENETYLNTWKNVQQQVDLAMKLVKSPLHRSQKPGPSLTWMEQFMLETEDRLIKCARLKMPGLWVLLRDKLMERFGPWYKPFVSQLVVNIMLQILITWQNIDQLVDIVRHIIQINYNFPTEESIKNDIVNMFALTTSSESPVEEMIDELVEKIELAFAEASTAEDELTVGMHNISVAK